MKKLIGFICVLLILGIFNQSEVYARSKLDIVFIIDRSGSMDDDIRAVRDNVSDFVDKVTDRGFEYQLGLVSYESSPYLYEMTSNVETFKENLNRIRVNGSTENGRDAIMKAIQDYEFEVNSLKYFVLIGDERIYSNRGYSHDEVIQTLIDNDITLTAIGIDEVESEFRNYTEGTGGLYLNLFDNFSDNLDSIFDQIQRVPTFEVTSPTPNQLLSDQDTAFTPTLEVTDPDSDTLTFEYYLDDETEPRGTSVVSNTRTAQMVNLDPINIANLTEGNHTFRFVVNDQVDVVEGEVHFRVDKTAPILNEVAITPNTTSISFAGSAVDSIAGLHSNPYRYSVLNAEQSQWTPNTTFTVNNLQPNTAYQAIFEARDTLGHIAREQRSMVTLAQSPLISFSSRGEHTLGIRVTDSNPASTQYVIRSGTRFVQQDGRLSATPQWITLSNKSITVTGLSSNTTYTFDARTRNSQLVETAYGNAISTKTLVPPPESIRTEVEQREIRLSWDSVSGILGYDIEVDGTVVSNGTSSTYLHTGLLPNTRHTYRVRVRNAGGIGSWSEIKSVQTLPDPPAVPRNLQFTATQTEIQLSWDIIAAAQTYDIEVDGSIVSNGDRIRYLHTGLEPFTEHTYRVRASNPGGTSEWGPLVTATTLPYPPQVPTNISAAPSIYSVSIGWDEMDGAEAYEIEVDGLIVDTGSATAYIHEGLEPLSGHTYRVRAKNTGGKSAWSQPIDITTHPEIPLQPTNILTTSDETAITLTWYKVPHTEFYEIEVDGSSIVKVTDTQFKHSELLADSKHTYKIRSYNISGYSEWSSPVTMMTLPAGSGVNMSLTNIAAVVTNTFITISWDTVAPNAEYEIEVDGELYDNGEDTIYHHTGLEANEFHIYKIRVIDDGQPGDWVAVLALSTLPNPPDAPEQLEAFATNHSIELSWNRIEGASGYDIEIDGKTYSLGGGLNYIHSGLESGISHTYRIRAKNITGVTAWSPAVTQSTTSPTYNVNMAANEPFDLSILASNVQDFSELTFVITYNPEEIELIDLYNFTPEQDLSSGKIPNSNLTAEVESGVIKLTVNQNVIPGTSWSGELSTLTFKGKTSGETSIDIVVE